MQLDNKGLWPEIINNFHLYKGAADGGEMLLGTTGEVELPSLEALKETMSGSGILGEIEVSNPGHFSATDIEIPYVAVCRGMFTFSPIKREMLTLRACAQSQMKSTGEISLEGMRIVLGGTCSDYKLGKLALGKKMDSSIKLALTYILIQIESDKVLELDKLNEVFIINNEDILADIKNKC